MVSTSVAVACCLAVSAQGLVHQEQRGAHAQERAGFAPAAAAAGVGVAHKLLCPGCTPIDGYRSVPTRPPAKLSSISAKCACLNWKDAYEKYGAGCGQGLELFLKANLTTAAGEEMTGRVKAKSTLQGDFCNNIYKKLDEGVCVNSNMGESKGQWCYVGHECADLNGGWRVRGLDNTWRTNVKLCTADDKSFRDHTPHQLAALAKDQGIEVGVLVKMAYPTVGSHTWEDVASFWTEKGHSLDEEKVKSLEGVVLSGRPVVWGSELGRPPFGVTMGMKAYEVGLDRVNGHTKWKCVHDCSMEVGKHDQKKYHGNKYDKYKL